jgi:hypothetical protein
MCRSQADGGRRCPASHSGSAGPPADGKTRIEVHTNKRSYSVIDGGSRVTWMPGEKVESMDVIDPSPSSAGGRDVGREDEERYLRRIEQLKHTEDVGALMTGEKFAVDADAAAEAAARIRAELEDDGEQWQ